MTIQRQLATFCRMCFGRCSLLVTVEDGKVTGVARDRDAPVGRDTPCSKGLALPEMLNHPSRLRYPLRRQGPKGAGKWAQISWNEALDTVASTLDGLRQEFGPESVALGLGDPKGLELAFAQRLASAFGTPNITTPGHICHMPGELGSTFTVGSPCVCDDGHPPSCMVVWGNNLRHTRNGMSPVQLNAALAGGAKLIVIDPRKTDLAARAHIWIRPRPGSDGALALGMIKVIVEEHLYDEAFTAQWILGFDQLEEHVKTFSMEQVEEITWVPPEQIREAARLYANTKPATVQGGNALDHSLSSFQTWRAASILRAISGNLDVPGGERLLMPPPVVRPGRFMLLREFPRNAQKMAGSQFKLAARSAFIPRQSLVKAILEEKPCPVKAALLFGTNPLLTFPKANDTRQALMKLEFLAVADLFMTPSAALADIVLPVATNCEFDEIGPYPGPTLLAYPKMVDPPGECWPDIKIINELAKRLGLKDYFWSDENEALDLILEPAGVTFKEFKERRILEGEKGYRKYEEKGFRTPSGKVEVYSKQLEEMGYSPLPLYAEVSRIVSSCAKPTVEYPLLLTNAKERTFCHSAHRNIASLRRARPDPVVEVNPEVAKGLLLKEGDWVYIETESGRIVQRLSLNADLDPRVAFASYGWWLPEKETSGLYRWNQSNINILTDDAPPYESELGSLHLRGVPCRIYGGESVGGP